MEHRFAQLVVGLVFLTVCLSGCEPRAATIETQTPPTATGSLEYHILAKSDVDPPLDFAAVIRACAQEGPESLTLKDYKWFAIAAGQGSPTREAVVAEWQGRNYVLAKTDLANSIDQRTKWALVELSMEQTHPDGAQINIALDAAGGEQMTRITGANLGRLLGTIVNGELVSSATIMSTIGAKGMITGPPDHIAKAYRLLEKGAKPGKH